MELNEKYKRLVVALAAKTLANEIDWKELPQPGVYLTSFRAYAVTIGEQQNRLDEDISDYEISLLNADGLVVDRFRDVDLDEGEGGSPWFTNMRELYEQARRKALGSDK